MPATVSSTRLSRVAVLAVTGATAFSVAACGSSNNAKPNPASSSSSAPSTSAPSASGKARDWVNGLIQSVSGNTIQVSQPSGTAAVDFTPSTTVSEITPAQLTDITPGSCVSVQPDRRSGSAGGAVTARAVRIDVKADGKCTQQPGRHQTRGQVAAVAGNTITLNTTDAQDNSSQTQVTVTDSTKYTKQTASDAHAIAQGKCIAARGTKDSGGALQAKNISVQPAENGSCPGQGGKHHGH
jgi:hypothetical protein